jgi:hypothetical protein
MSKKSKKEFERRFQSTIAESLRKVTVSEELRGRVLSRLHGTNPELPEGWDEACSEDFADRLSSAVQRSQEWAPEDVAVLRAEAVVSAEMKVNVLSERAVGALLQGHDAPECLNETPTPEDKLRFAETLRTEIKRSTGELTAPEETHQKLLGALRGEIRVARTIIPFPSKTQWRRGLSALTSLAAGFAIVFLTLFGSADVALANSVRADHQMCCRKAMGMQDTASRQLKAMMETQYGRVPVPPIDSSWTLRVSQICQTDQGKPMVHLLYTRLGEDEKVESMSFHFIPDQGTEKEKLNLNSEEVQDLSNGDFPVIAWLEGGWVCTACSPDLDAGTLKEVASPGL